jgi:hypothetical protein
MSTPIVRRDSLPEHAVYRDDGCRVADECLNCPLELCIYDDPAELVKTSRAYRDDRIFTLRKKGVSATEIGRNLKISARTVHRVIQRGGASEIDRREIAEHLRGIQALLNHRPSGIYKSRDPLPWMAGGAD